MLYALRTPIAFVALAIGFLLGVLVRGMLQAQLARRLLNQRTATAYGRGGPNLRRHLDPFGAVAAAIGGVGWGRSIETTPLLTRHRGRLAVVLLAGPLSLLILGSALILGYLAVGGSALIVRAVLSVGAAVHGNAVPTSIVQTLLLLSGVELVGMGLLALIPLPPLDGGQLLFTLAPRSYGWQRAHYQLVDHNWGIVALLVLLIIPLAGGEPLVLFLVDLLAHPLFLLLAAL